MLSPNDTSPHAAASNGHKAVVDILIAAGTDLISLVVPSLLTTTPQALAHDLTPSSATSPHTRLVAFSLTLLPSSLRRTTFEHNECRIDSPTFRDISNDATSKNLLLAGERVCLQTSLDHPHEERSTAAYLTFRPNAA